jgi:hypothetical protein
MLNLSQFGLFHPNLIAASQLQAAMLNPLLPLYTPNNLLLMNFPTNPLFTNYNVSYAQRKESPGINNLLASQLMNLKPTLLPSVSNQITLDQKTDVFENPPLSQKIDSETTIEPDEISTEPTEELETKKRKGEKGEKSTSTAEIWIPEKINLLLVLAQKYKRDWKKISKKLNDRRLTPFQVKSKYCALTSKNSIGLRVKFSLKEDLILAKNFNLYKFDWEKIAAQFKGQRDAIMLKNRYYAHIRKRNLLDKLLNMVQSLEKINGIPVEETEVADSNAI